MWGGIGKFKWVDENSYANGTRVSAREYFVYVWGYMSISEFTTVSPK